MQRIITYTILSGDSETSVLSFLRKNGFSKHILTTMKRAEHAILLNGHPAFGRTVLKEGDVLRILVPEENGAADNGSAFLMRMASSHHPGAAAAGYPV